MNMQAILKQAQKMQGDITKAKQEIDNALFTGKSSLIEVEMNGKKELKRVTIDRNCSLDQDDYEMLEDMILLAVNDATSKIDKEIESKLGSFASGMPGLF